MASRPGFFKCLPKAIRPTHVFVRDFATMGYLIVESRRVATRERLSAKHGFGESAGKVKENLPQTKAQLC